MSRPPAPRRPRLAVVPLLVAAALLAGTTVPAGAQAAPPEVAAVASFGPESGIYVDCSGVENELVSPVAGVLFERDGDLTDPLTVPVSIGGTLAANVVDPPTEVTFEADEDFTDAIFEIDPYEPGTLTLTIEPGPDHEVGDPATVVLDPVAFGTFADCNDPIELAPAQADQTITVGGTPQSLGIFDRCDDLGDDAWFDDEVCFLADILDTVVEPGPPPGLTYRSDRWTGTATTPGTYDLQVRLCLEDAFLGLELQTRDLDPDALRAFAAAAARAVGDVPDACLGTAEARITVVAADSTAPPARPIEARARFTG